MLSTADELARHSLCRDKTLGISAPSWSCACQGWTRTVSFNAAIVLHATHQATALRAARTVTTTAELGALPAGTILVDPRDDTGYLVDGVGWEHIAKRLDEHPRPLVVVWHPALDGGSS